MNENHTPQDDEIRALLVEAGPPMELPSDDLEAIRRAAEKEWRGMSVTPIFEGRSAWRPLAIAASLLLALAAGWLYWSGRSPIAAATVATVELFRGEGAQTPLAIGDELPAGTELSTVASGDSPVRLALRMASGHSVRLDANSKIRLTSALGLELEHGAVYVDSGPEGASSGLEILTPLGIVREIGTQYEVRLNGTMSVRVREGIVSLTSSAQTFSATGGEQLTVDASGEVDRYAVAVSGPLWTWVLETAPGIDVEGRSLGTYLDWIARETGWQVRYEDPSLERKSAEIVYGSIEDMTLEQSLGVVLASTDLGYRLEDGVLVITRASGR